jgi:hypothetical protein
MAVLPVLQPALFDCQFYRTQFCALFDDSYADWETILPASDKENHQNTTRDYRA